MQDMERAFWDRQQVCAEIALFEDWQAHRNLTRQDSMADILDTPGFTGLAIWRGSLKSGGGHSICRV
jgi:hypothetical protein